MFDATEDLEVNDSSSRLFNLGSLILTFMKANVAIVLVTLLVSACGKSNEQMIPDVPFDYQVSLQAFQVNKVNGILLVPNIGVAGLIIIQKSSDSFAAYDRCSSVNPLQRCAVTVDDNGLTATDPCSGAKFSLYDGTPVKAPAKRSLKMYQVITTSASITVLN